MLRVNSFIRYLSAVLLIALVIFPTISNVSPTFADGGVCNKIQVERTRNGIESTILLYENGTWYGEGGDSKIVYVDPNTSFKVLLWRSGGTSPWTFRLIGPGWDSGDQISTGSFRVFSPPMGALGSYHGRVDLDSWKNFEILQKNPDPGTIRIRPNLPSADWKLYVGNSLIYTGTGDYDILTSPNDYKIEWQHVTGFVTPPSETKYLPAGGTITFEGLYTVIPFEVTDVSIDIDPEDPQIVYQGETVTGDGTITGIGDGTVEYRWMVRKPGGVFWQSSMLSTTMSSGSASIPTYSGFPTSDIGQHKVWVRIESPGGPDDSLSNNEYYTVEPPSIAVTDVSIDIDPEDPQIVYQGETVTGDGTITGIGDGTVEYRWMVRKPGGVFWQSSMLSTTMSSGSANIPTYSGFPTSDIGQHKVWVRINSPGGPDDSLSNEEFYTTRAPECDPDFEGVPRDCAQVEGCVVTFQNLTNGCTQPYKEMWWDFNGDGVIETIKSGAQVMDPVSWDYSQPGWGPGDYTVCLSVFDGNDVLMTQCQDNCITVTASASPDLPDLEVTSVSSDVWQSAAVGDSVQWAATVRNNGPANLTNSWTLSWYLSTDTSWGSDIYIGSQSYGDDISAGSYSGSKSKSFNVPSGASGQQYYVLATVETTPDGNAGNNWDVSSNRDWFGSISDDSDEPNGVSAFATNLGTVTGTLTRNSRTLTDDGDNDWYKFEMLGTGASGDKVRIDFTNIEGDLILRLYDAGVVGAGTLLDTSDGSGNYEEISLSGRPDGTYYFEIDGFDDDVSRDYDITVTSSASPICPALSYPPDRWQRVWYDWDDNCLGEGPDETNEQFDNDWGTGELAYSRSNRIQFTSGRKIYFPDASIYRFVLGSDDGSRLYIDGSLKIDYWSSHSYHTQTVDVDLSAGYHNLRIDYFENTDKARLSFSYSRDSTPPLISGVTSNPSDFTMIRNNIDIYVESIADPESDIESVYLYYKWPGAPSYSKEPLGTTWLNEWISTIECFDDLNTYYYSHPGVFEYYIEATNGAGLTAQSEHKKINIDVHPQEQELEIVSPTIGLPTIQLLGNSFTIILASNQPLPTDGSSWNVKIKKGERTIWIDNENVFDNGTKYYYEYRLPVESVSCDNGYWYSVTVGIPLDVIDELYDLTVEVSGKSDTQENAVQIRKVVPSFPKFFHLTDTHIGFDSHPAYPGHPYSPNIDEKTVFKKEIDEINLIRPDFIIISGDLNDWSSQYNWEQFRTLLKLFDVPVFTQLGNHDYYLHKPGSLAWLLYGVGHVTAIDYYLQNINSYDNYSFDCGSIHVVGLDTGYGTSLFASSALSDWQMRWLENDLVGKNNSYIFMHHPVYHTDTCLLNNRDSFVDLCSNHIDGEGNYINVDVDAVYSGHVHSEYGVYLEGSTYYVTSPATTRSDPPSYRLVSGWAPLIPFLPFYHIEDYLNGPFNPRLYVDYVVEAGDPTIQTAIITNDLCTLGDFVPVDLSDIALKFFMPKDEYEISSTDAMSNPNAEIVAAIDGTGEYDSSTIYYVTTDIAGSEIKSVTLSPKGARPTPTPTPIPKPVIIRALCPVDLSVEDPDGMSINKQSSQISGATYVETDINDDGDLDDVVTIPNPKDGDYKITVIPEPGALPADTYSLEVETRGETTVLADNVQIDDIPSEPYAVEWTAPAPTFVILNMPAGINVDPVAFNLVYYDGVEVTLPTGTEPPELIAVYYYDPVALELLYYFPGWPSLMTQLEHGKVYLVIVSDACQWPIPPP